MSLVAERAAFVNALKETVQRASGLRDALWGDELTISAPGAARAAPPPGHPG